MIILTRAIEGLMRVTDAEETRGTDGRRAPDYFLAAVGMETLQVYYFVRLPEADVMRLFPPRALREHQAEVVYFEPIANFSGRVKLILNGSVSGEVKAFLEQALPMTYVVLTKGTRPDALQSSTLQRIETASLERSVYKLAAH